MAGKVKSFQELLKERALAVVQEENEYAEARKKGPSSLTVKQSNSR